MRLAFGKAVGTAARVDANQKILTVYSTPSTWKRSRTPLTTAPQAPDLPSHLKVSEIKVSGRIVAAPKLVGERVVNSPKVEEVAAEPAKGAAEAPAKGGKAGATGKGAAAAAAKAEPANG